MYKESIRVYKRSAAPALNGLMFTLKHSTFIISFNFSSSFLFILMFLMLIHAMLIPLDLDKKYHPCQIITRSDLTIMQIVDL